MERLERALEALAERAEVLPDGVLADRLERDLAGEPEAVVVSLHERWASSPQPPRRWRGPAIAAAAFLLVMGAGLGDRSHGHDITGDGGHRHGAGRPRSGPGDDQSPQRR